MDNSFDAAASLLKIFRDPLLKIHGDTKSYTYDIRVKSNQPLTIYGRYGIRYIDKNGRVYTSPDANIIYCSENDMKAIFLDLCSYSIFSHEDEIKKGYISVNDSYRVGIGGTAVTKDGEVTNIKKISSLVFRIPREQRGCSKALFMSGIDFSSGILIVGEPSSGKTTLLRDIAYSLSNRIFSESKKVTVLDERNEISGCFNLGPCVDVLKGFPKNAGFDTAIRTLSPEIIICDELSDKDLNSINQCVFCGVPIIASMHGNYNSFMEREICRDLIYSGAFKTIVFLKGRINPTEIDKIYTAGDLIENYRSNLSSSERLTAWSNESKQPKKKRGNVA